MTFQQYPQKLGIPSGNTAGRPSNPVIGDTYYNGQLEILEIYNGTQWVANSAPPATPAITSVTDIGTVDYTSGGSLAVLFTPGSGGGTPNQYNAFTTSGGFTAFDPTTTVTLTGLTPATAFTIYGNAQNNFGTTVNTPNASAVTATTRPQSPSIGTATTSGNDVIVTWTLNNNGGKTLSAITVTPFLNGTTAETSRTAATTSSTSYTFTSGQLTSGSSYTFKVTTTNANGTSPFSAASNSITVPSLIVVDFVVLAGGGGGAGGGQGSAYAGAAGGCGGAGAAYLTSATGNGGAGTANQGFDGGAAQGAGGDYGSGGGGGVGSVGTTSVGNTGGGTAGGNGGSGIASSITGSSVTYGAGGKGYSSGGGDSPVNLGKGGDGKTEAGGGNGRAGGSGVVILRYPSSDTITIGAGLTGTTATVGANKVTTITQGTGNVSWS